MATVTEKLHDGNTSAATTYSFPFQYIKLTDVKVEVLEGSPLAWVSKTKDTDYEFPTATTVKFKDTKTPPAGTDNVRIYRETDSAKLTGSFYPNAAIRSQDLNENFNQGLFLSQETENDSDTALSYSRELNTTTGVWKTAIGEAAAAVITADAADAIADGAKVSADNAIEATDALVGKKDSSGNWYARGHGSGGTDSEGNASTEDGVGKALADSANAVSVATAADNIADDALANSRTKTDGSEAITAPGTYTSAIFLADQADTNATTALNNSRNSASPPVSAISIAEDAATDAATALSNSRNTASPPVSAISIAEDALDNSRKSDGATPPVYTSAIDVADAATVTAGNAVDTADAAVVTANTASANATAAQNAVTNAELFTPYATVSDIPANNISSITVTAGGSVYESVPTVTITNTTGSTGSGAIATAVLTDGVVTSITVNTPGNNYTNGATVAIAASTGTDGTDATASAVLGPLNEDKAEVADSTGLESFTPLTGIPAGFVLGDDGLTVKLKYNTTPTPDTWEWVNYYSNDPESRYRKKLIVENKRIIDEDYAVGVDNHGFSIGPVTIAATKTITIPANSKYVVMN
tara:strand:- start:930 stop:2693 length:1764 start_codon:yes stop_codon:yes gene_type:complete